MTKVMLHLSVNPEIVELAKSLGLNLSQEFEDWLKIRTNQFSHDIKEPKDIDMEIAKFKAEILKLENEKEVKQKAEYMDKEALMVIDYQIDDMVKHEDTTNDIISRASGLQYLFKRKFNKLINPLEAKELLENRIKERGVVLDG